MVTGSAERWFAPGFLDREPGRGSALLVALQETVDEGYVQVCAALAEFDVRDRLAEIGTPVLAVSGSADTVTPPDRLRAIAEGVQDGRFVELDGVAHLAPAEAPEAVAALIRQHVLGEAAPRRRRTGTPPGWPCAARCSATSTSTGRSPAATDLTREFQSFITEYAWGEIWTRPGLDRRSRSMITLTALIARGHHEELAMHLRAALRNGLTVEEIKEVILQSAIYCGVPDANTAFRIAQQVLAEEGLP